MKYVYVPIMLELNKWVRSIEKAQIYAKEERKSKQKEIKENLDIYFKKYNEG